MPSWKDTFPGSGMKKQATITKQQNKENVLIPSSLWVSKTDRSLGGMQCQQWGLTEGEVSQGLLQGLRSDSKKSLCFCWLAMRFIIQCSNQTRVTSTSTSSVLHPSLLWHDLSLCLFS